MKFIRNYKTKEEFESDYYDNGGVEVVSITCELGTFTFDRVEYIESFGKNVYRWTNGEKTLDTGKRIQKLAIAHIMMTLMATEFLSSRTMDSRNTKSPQ